MPVQKINLVRNALLTLFVIYYAQGSLYPTGSIISQGALAGIFCISGIYLLKTLFLKGNKNTFYYTWTALLFLNILGFLLTGNISNADHYSMLKGILMTGLTFYPLYHFAKLGALNAKHLIWFFLFMLPVSILQYRFNASQIIAERVGDNIYVVNNISYYFVALIPYVFLLKHKKILSVFLMLILLFFIIQGSKRGAIIAGFLGVCWFIYFHFRTIPKRQKLKGYLFVLVALFALSYYAYDVYMNNEYLISRMEALTEGDSSGRDKIYSSIITSWASTNNFLNLIFGFGFAASLELSGTGNFAHNDWLELLSNFGIIGVSLYLILFFTALRYVKVLHWGADKRILFLTIILMWFFTSMVSMAYPSGIGYIQTLLLAYLIGSRSNKLD